MYFEPIQPCLNTSMRSNASKIGIFFHIKLVEYVKIMRKFCFAGGFSGGTVGKWRGLQAQLRPLFSTFIGVQG